jgi:putative ABC transport system permease protein
MYQQVEHMTTRHPGFDKEHVVMMPVSGHGQNTNFARSIRAFKASASVLSVATVDRGPGGRPRPRLFRRADTGRTAEVSMLFADSAFARTMGLEMLAGTWIRERIAAEGTPGVVLNATAARRLGFAAPREAVGALVGRIHPDDPDSVGTPSRVVGVVRDFRWSSVRETAPPMVITPADIKYNLEYWVIRVAPGATQPTLRHLEATWKALAFYPEMYDYSFLSDDWSALYRTERHLQQVTSVFAALAVVIACLGLFGLATYTARRRTKEIGIRKALGATVGHIVGLLSAAFLRRVGLAALVALPVAYVAVRVWLQQFADRVALSPWLFAAAVAAALTLAALTVSVQALRAARLDPVDALRDE